MGRTSLRPWFMGNKMQFEAVACRLFLHYSYTFTRKASNYGIFCFYYKYKEYLKREHNDWFSAAIILFDKYEEMKDPVAWMKRQEEYAEHEKHSKQIQADHAARETQAELREWQLSRRDGAVQCPYCKSWDTDPISTASRVASVALVGVASGKIGKQFHCNKCGANF